MVGNIEEEGSVVGMSVLQAQTRTKFFRTEALLPARSLDINLVEAEACSICCTGTSTVRSSFKKG